MYQEFCILDVEPKAYEKKLIIYTNKDLSRTRFETEAQVQVYERQSKSEALFTKSIDETNKNIVIEFNDWPIPNTEYIVSVKNLYTVVDEPIESNIKKKVVFPSTIASTITITEPAMFQQIKENNLTVTFIETSETSELINSYYLEIGTNTAFDNIVVHSNVKEKSVKIDVPAPNQYFLRVRAEKEDKSEYGKWSDTISFRVGDRINTEDKDDPNYNDHNYDIDPDIKKDPDIDDPKKDNPDEPDIDIDLETFEVLNKIKQNVTPENILLQLSKEIDPDCVPNIMIIKSEVE